MIELKNISKVLDNGQKILNNINIKFEDNKFVSIIGESGSGKTSMLQVIGLLDTDVKGEVVIDNANVLKCRKREIEEIRKEKISFVYQNANLITCLSAYDNIRIAYHGSEKGAVVEQEIMTWMKTFGIDSKKNASVETLSGGEAQRVSIIRALINKPKILLCDEPTGALDSDNSKKVLDTLLEIQKKNKITLIIVTHDSSIADRAQVKYCMKDGCII